MKSYRDYTGVAVWQFSDVFEELRGGRSITEIAASVPGNTVDRDLRKVVIDKAYVMTGLDLADRILLGLGANISALASAGILTVIPTPGPNAPRKMAADEFWAMEVDPSSRELNDRARELAHLRDTVLSRS